VQPDRELDRGADADRETIVPTPNVPPSAIPERARRSRLRATPMRMCAALRQTTISESRGPAPGPRRVERRPDAHQPDPGEQCDTHAERVVAEPVDETERHQQLDQAADGEGVRDGAEADPRRAARRPPAPRH
jgi:hypothetical protein